MYIDMPTHFDPSTCTSPIEIGYIYMYAISSPAALGLHVSAQDTLGQDPGTFPVTRGHSYYNPGIFEYPPSVDYNGRSSDICRATATNGRALAPLSDVRRGRPGEYVHTRNCQMWLAPPRRRVPVPTSTRYTIW